MLHPKTIALTKKAILATLTDTCEVQAAGARTADGHGGYKTTYVTKTGQSALPCRAIKPGAGKVQTFADRIRGRCTLEFLFEAQTSIDNGDLIIYQGTAYVVIDVSAPITDEFVRPVLTIVSD